MENSKAKVQELALEPKNYEDDPSLGPNNISNNTAINEVSIEPKPQAPMHPPPAQPYGDLSQLEKKMATTAVSHIWKLNYVLLGFDFCVPLITIICGFVFILF